MALRNPLKTFTVAADQINLAADRCRQLRDSTGTINLNLIDGINLALHNTKIAVVQIQALAALDQVTVETKLAEIGGPASYADFRMKAQAANQAANAWSNGLATWLNSLPATAFVQIVTQTTQGVDFPVIQMTRQVDQANSDLIRNSNQLANLIAALEDMGA